MEITDIRIRKILNDGRLRAVVSVTVDRMLAVHDLKVVQGDDRLFVAMPSRKDENGTYRDIVHPIRSDARKQLEEAVLAAYQKELAAAAAKASEPAAGKAETPAAGEAEAPAAGEAEAPAAGEAETPAAGETGTGEPEQAE